MDDEITYIVEYDEIVHRRCEITLTAEQDHACSSTAEAIDVAVDNCATDKDFITRITSRVTSWSPV